MKVENKQTIEICKIKSIASGHEKLSFRVAKAMLYDMRCLVSPCVLSFDNKCKEIVSIFVYLCNQNKT